MREVRDLMQVGGSLPMDEILAGLRQSIHRGAWLHREPLDAGTLRKKMAMRVGYKRFFEEGPGGTIVRKAAKAYGVHSCEGVSRRPWTRISTTACSLVPQSGVT